MDGNRLYYGDNLDVLREKIDPESVDLIYLDPPFNSHANYNVLFRAPTGEQSQAQIEAFEDTWHWNENVEEIFHQVIMKFNSNVAELLRAIRSFLNENDMMAYITMMSARMIELHRVLKPQGAIYLHCDPTASHYLKILLDAVFDPKMYVNEIIWKRYGAHNDVGQGSKHFGRVHDTIFFYSKSSQRRWSQMYGPLDSQYVAENYTHVDEGTGRKYRLTPLTGPGGAEKGNPVYEWNGHTRAWRVSRTTMQKFHDEGMLHYYKKTGYVAKKLYLDGSKGTPIQSVWSDLPSLSGSHAERLGYPTQKPLALLERIINASSIPGDVVLDPFCGCGTAIHAAQKLGRRWIGVDVTHLAISLIERRLRAAFGTEARYEVIGTPRDLDGARDLARRDKYQFQWWAVSLVDAVPYQGRKKGADGGIDGIIWFRPDGKAVEKAIVSVKGGDNVGVGMIRDLAHVVERERAKIGVFVTLAEPTVPMQTEAVKAGAFETPFGRYPKLQIMTVAELLAGAKPRIPLIDPTVFKAPTREDASRERQAALL